MAELLKVMLEEVDGLRVEKDRYDRKLLPPYSEDEIREFEDLNGFRLPKDFYNYITGVSRVIHRGGTFHIFNIYEDDKYYLPEECNFCSI